MRISAVAPMVGVTLVVLLAGCGQSTGPATLPAGAVTFDVPTYEWGRDGGMDAGVTGHLAFTDEGCTMLYQPGQEDQALPLVFPNATGIRYSNGVRAVIDEHGELYGVEGQQVSYAGGWVDPNESWTATCGAYDGPEVVMVNDEPAHGALETEPPPPGAAVPTRLPTAADLGWYDVPTFEWDPAEGGDAALLEGRVEFTDDGCAVIDHDGVRSGLVLPNAKGHRGDHPGGAGIYATFPEEETLIAEPGARAFYGGGFHDNSGEFGDEWTRLCPSSAVDNLFYVYVEDPWQ